MIEITKKIIKIIDRKDNFLDNNFELSKIIPYHERTNK
jgi:hypothetical protein